MKERRTVFDIFCKSDGKKHNLTRKSAFLRLFFNGIELPAQMAELFAAHNILALARHVERHAIQKRGKHFKLFFRKALKRHRVDLV